MRLACRLAGALLLLLAGSGSGVAIYWHRRDAWQQLRTFTLLLLYLQRMVDYRSATAQSMLLAACAYPQFAALHLERCHSFAELPLPASLGKTLCDELQADLGELAAAPRRAVCESLKRMYSLCLTECQRAEDSMHRARALYPRLGVCLGILAAILFY